MTLNNDDVAAISKASAQMPDALQNHSQLHELLTVEDVAALLKVSRSWVYEHTRSRAHAARPARSVCRTSRSANTRASIRRPFANSC